MTAGLQQPKGVAIRAAWLTWRHLAASRGRDAECAFRVARTAHSGLCCAQHNPDYVTPDVMLRSRCSGAIKPCFRCPAIRQGRIYAT